MTNKKNAINKESGKRPSLYQLWGKIGALRKEVLYWRRDVDYWMDKCFEQERLADHYKRMYESSEEHKEWLRSRLDDGKDRVDTYIRLCNSWQELKNDSEKRHEDEISRKDEEITRLRQIIYNLTGRDMENELIITPTRIRAVLPTWPCN